VPVSTSAKVPRRAIPLLPILLGAAAFLAFLAVGALILPSLLAPSATATPSAAMTPTPPVIESPVPTLRTTPVFTGTMASTSTATPAQPTATLAPTNTPLKPTAASGSTGTAPPTAEPAATAASVPAPILLAPREENAASLHGSTTFEWSYPRALRADEAFQVLIWQEGQTHAGVYPLGRETNAVVRLDDVPQVKTAGAGTYFWSVVVVQARTETKLSSEASPWQFNYSGPGE